MFVVVTTSDQDRCDVQLGCVESDQDRCDVQVLGLVLPRYTGAVVDSAAGVR